MDEEEENEGCVEMNGVHDEGSSTLMQCFLCDPCAFPSLLSLYSMILFT